VISRALALVALTVLALAPAPANGSGDVVQAEQFVLRDRQGNVVGALSAGEGDRAGLVLYDKDGTVRLVLDVRPDGAPALTLTDDEGGHRVQLGIVGELLSALASQDMSEWPRTLQRRLASPGLQESLMPRLPYGAAILAVALLAVTALVLLVALVILDRRSLRSTQQFHELWDSIMQDRERERAAFRDNLLSQHNAANVQTETLDRCVSVGTDVARALERMRGDIEQQLRRLREKHLEEESRPSSDGHERA
jgi:hypothetical protein